MLSVLSMANLVLVYAFVKDANLQDILNAMNVLLSGIFMADFVYRMATASSKADYFFRQSGWADLLASVPLPQFKVLRAFRLIRVFRLLRELGAQDRGSQPGRRSCRQRAVHLLMAGILVLEFGSLGILRVEQYAVDANITTASDALWYTIVTISTVGYGDQYPVTEAGRIMGTLIIVVGVGIFGTFTGYLANFFLAPRKKATEDEPASA